MKKLGMSDVVVVVVAAVKYVRNFFRSFRISHLANRLGLSDIRKRKFRLISSWLPRTMSRAVEKVSPKNDLI